MSGNHAASNVTTVVIGASGFIGGTPVAPLLFILDSESIDHELFIVSDDDSLINIYSDIENRLFANFGKSYPDPKVFVPEFFLGVLLRLAGKSNIKLSMKYSI